MYPKNFQNLIDQFSSLPSIGPKLAERLVLSLFKDSPDRSKEFADVLTHLHNVRTCAQCFNIAEDELCLICSNKNRDTSILCIVEDPLDIIPIERAQSYNGLYHVLGGTISGSDATHLSITELEHRIDSTSVKELIIATNFTTEGDMTAMYIQRRLSEKTLKITRLVRGLATGSDIEYADDLTIKSALTHRTEI